MLAYLFMNAYSGHVAMAMDTCVYLLKKKNHI